jgi:hypothetical protein
VPPRRPQRYAPRRPSALRVSRTRLDGRDAASYSTVHQPSAFETDAGYAMPRCGTPVPSDASTRQQSMGVIANISIPEEISKKSKGECDGVRQHMRIDSGNTDMASAKHSSSDSSSAVRTPLSGQSFNPMSMMPISPTSLAPTPRSIANTHLQQPWSIPHPSSKMPFSTHQRSFDQLNTGFGRSVTPTQGLHPGMSNKAGTAVDHHALATVPPEQLMNDHNVNLEAEYWAFNLIASGGSVSTPRTFTGMREERCMTPHGLGRDIGASTHRPRTMMEVIEEKERGFARCRFGTRKLRCAAREVL